MDKIEKLYQLYETLNDAGANISKVSNLSTCCAVNCVEVKTTND